jgi:nitrile hydratase beta subunit
MNGPHDMGGRMGLGPVAPEADEPAFHAGWETRAFGLTLAVGALGRWSLDESRHVRECLPWPFYLSAGYYEIWVKALEILLQRHGLVSAGELADPEGVVPEAPHPRRMAAAVVPAALARGGPCARPVTQAPRFLPGARVRARNLQPQGHCRMPGYVRGHLGRIEAEHGGFVLPDSHAHGRGEAPERLYTVVFEGPELWGAGTDPALVVSVDLWESYLEPA